MVFLTNFGDFVFPSVTLSRTSDAPTTFRGILLQARDSTDTAVGSWLIEANSDYRYLTDCPEPFSQFGSLTHNSRDDKSLTSAIVFNWLPPSTNVGNIRFL